MYLTKKRPTFLYCERSNKNSTQVVCRHIDGQLKILIVASVDTSGPLTIINDSPKPHKI